MKHLSWIRGIWYGSEQECAYTLCMTCYVDMATLSPIDITQNEDF